MTEYDLFIMYIPMIAKIAIDCRKLKRKEYEEWKQNVLVECPDKVKKFIEKVLIVIDDVVLENR